MHINSQTVETTGTLASERANSRLTPSLIVAALGLGLLFVAGFAESQVLHNATHDTRHSTGFPCH